MIDEVSIIAIGTYPVITRDVCIDVYIDQQYPSVGRHAAFVHTKYMLFRSILYSVGNYSPYRSLWPLEVEMRPNPLFASQLRSARVVPAIQRTQLKECVRRH